MIDKVTEKLDAYNYSLGLFIDLSQAFDTLDHAILIDKLEFYGVRGCALNLFRSYHAYAHGSALRCVRNHSRSIWNMANLTPL